MRPMRVVSWGNCFCEGRPIGAEHGRMSNCLRFSRGCALASRSSIRMVGICGLIRLAPWAVPRCRPTLPNGAHPISIDTSIGPLPLMMVLGVLSWVSGVRRPSCTDVLLFLGSGAAGLLSSRHIALFAVVATPIVARSVMQVLHRTTASKLIIGQIASRSVGSNRARLNWTILAVGLLATSVVDHSEVAAERGGDRESVPEGGGKNFFSEKDLPNHAATTPMHGGGI